MDERPEANTDHPTDGPRPAPVRDQRGRWLPGTPSPNPHGRRRGSRNRRSRTPVRLDWPAIRTMEEIDVAVTALLSGVALGDIAA